MGCLWDECECCMCVSSTQLDQLASWGPMGWVRGDRICAGVLSGQRHHAGACGIHEFAHACEHGECGVRAMPVTFCLCQPKRSRGHGCLCLCPVWVLKVGAAGDSALSVAVCVTSNVNVLCICVCMCLCLWDMCLALLLAEPIKGKAAASSLRPGESPGP